jgi:4-hydroxy-3-polyprenylbenzoate decarboxylase
MPLPEGLSELTFAGMFAGRNFRYKKQDGFVISADADFCIIGEIALDQLKPEGPFGDHLGYYSLKHDFPFLRVKKVYHRRNAVWPFTVVGRPPQEDTSFGHLIHEVTASLVPKEIPGVKALQAVDEAGVHPLLLAIGKERYVPYAERRPMELNTIAHRILGFGQCSLAKYLLLVAEEDDPALDVNNTRAFFQHLLERFDPENDLHFQTRTTIDTLDYSGEGINRGSKLVIVACGKKKRTLDTALPSYTLPAGFGAMKCVAPGILAVSGPAWQSENQNSEVSDAKQLATAFENEVGFPLIVLCDDAEFVSATFENFLWVTFTRSNPSHDVHGIGEFTSNKHFGATRGILIDARRKPHHAPALDVAPSIKALASEILDRALRQSR